MAHQPTPWLTREETAARLKMSAKRLGNMAAEKDERLRGPPFWNPGARKSATGPKAGLTGGRVRYHIELCDRWLMGDESIPCGLQTSPFPGAPPVEDAALLDIIKAKPDQQWARAAPKRKSDNITNNIRRMRIKVEEDPESRDLSFWMAADDVAASLLAKPPVIGAPRVIPAD